jgi:CubicO group peptidase (beta-lactamase class C family)
VQPSPRHSRRSRRYLPASIPCRRYLAGCPSRWQAIPIEELLTHTGTDTTGIRPGHAHGYYADGQQPVPYPMSAFFADGGLYSTAADLQRWDSAVGHSTLIPATLIRQMLALHATCPPPGSPGGCLTAADLGYGYGWFIDDTSHGRRCQHAGQSCWSDLFQNAGMVSASQHSWLSCPCA